MDKKYIRKRMIEIFQDYAMDKDEEYFEINMYFRKSNGETQRKHLVWAKPNPDLRQMAKSLKEQGRGYHE